MDVATLGVINGTSCNNTSKENFTVSTVSTLGVFNSSDMVEICICCIVFLIGTPGNIYVIRTFAFTNKRDYAGAKFVVALGLVDLVTSSVCPIFAIYVRVMNVLEGSYPAGILGRSLCYVKSNMFASLLGASSWCLVIIACVRFRLVSKLFIILK